MCHFLDHIVMGCLNVVAMAAFLAAAVGVGVILYSYWAR